MYGGIYSEAVGGGSQNPFRLASLTVIIHIFSPTYVLLNALYLYPMKAYKGDPARRDNTRTRPMSPQDIRLLEALRERSPYPGGAISVRQTPEDVDSVAENVFEFFDLTGVSSWDDAQRAYASMKQRDASLPNFNEFVDMLGALPGVGKFSKPVRAAGALINLAKPAINYSKYLDILGAYDSAQDIYQDNIK
tara:strand:+ start:113 stop:688 length:576 start_codon:yes stop_codon:yes gene_type:complete